METTGRQAEARRLRTEVIRVDAGTGGGGEVVEVGREVRGRRRGADAAAGHAAEDEVEGRGLRAAVELRLDLLRVGVRRQLLAAALRQEEQAVVLRVRHFELVGAHATHLLHGGVRAHLEGLGRAAAVKLLQRHPQVVLRGAEGAGISAALRLRVSGGFSTSSNNQAHVNTPGR